MTDASDERDSGTDPPVVRQPLPPETPPPPSQSPPAVPDDLPDKAATDEGTPGRDWWDGDGVRDELRDAWGTEGEEAAAAAREVGYQMQQAAGHISDAVAATAYPAAARHGLDIRWMRLSINLPAVALALLATWGGRTATERMTHAMTVDGLLAPLGWVLLAGLLLLVIMFLPLAGPLTHFLGHVFAAAGQVLVSAVQRGWRTPGIGYVMRLVIAWTVWAFTFGVMGVAGRGIIHWLTGA